MKFQEALRSTPITRTAWERAGFDRRVEVERGQPVIYEDDESPSPWDLSEEDLEADDWIVYRRPVHESFATG